MDEKTLLMNVDKKFCQDCVTGKEEAWASYFLEDGLMVTSGERDNLVGKEQIKAAMKGTFDLPDVDFYWEPVHCEVNGELGVTRGVSTLSYTKDGERVTHHGNYTTIWKKVNDEWKIIWDIGN